MSARSVTQGPVITITNLNSEDKARGPSSKGGNESPEAPFPQAAREFAEKTVDQMRETYERSNRTLEAAVQTLAKSFDAAVHGAAAQRRNIIDIAQKNLNLGFDLAKSLAGTSSLSEIVELQAAYWRKQFDAFTTQAEEVRGAAKPKAVETSRESIQCEPPKETPPPAQQAPKKWHSPAERDPVAERQRRDRYEFEAPPAYGTTVRKSPKKGAAQDEARQQILPAEIKFGIFDGNAVRFTSLEAWWLVDGVWHPISPGEVLLNAAVMREARFNQVFPQVPRLPSNAFKTDDLQN